MAYCSFVCSVVAGLKTKTKNKIPNKNKIDNINLKDNRVTFEDFTKSTPFKIDTKKFNVKLHDISLLPDEKGKLFLDVDIEDFLAPYHEYINAGGYLSALLTDNGFGYPELHEMLMVTSTIAGLLACYSDKINKEPDSFYPLKCEDVDYVGVEPFSLTL